MMKEQIIVTGEVEWITHKPNADTRLGLVDTRLLCSGYSIRDENFSASVGDTIRGDLEFEWCGPASSEIDACYLNNPKVIKKPTLTDGEKILIAQGLNPPFYIYDNDIENMDEANQLMMYAKADNIEMAIETMEVTRDNLGHYNEETLSYCKWMTQRYLKGLQPVNHKR